ncbi:MAG: two-component sensor histidine kinase [Neolewinella sp.]|jgi:hypothetical protein
MIFKFGGGKIRRSKGVRYLYGVPESLNFDFDFYCMASFMNNWQTLTILSLLILPWGGTNLLSGQKVLFSDPVIKSYGLDEGLQHRTTYSSAYDRDSLLWFSTEAGICRHDGHQLTTFSHLLQHFNGKLHLNQDSLLMAVHQNIPDSIEVFNPVSLTASGYRLRGNRLGAFAGASQRSGMPLYFAQGGFIYRFQPGIAPLVVHKLGSEVSTGDRLIYSSPSEYLLYREAINKVEHYNGNTIHETLLPPAGSFIKFHYSKNGRLWIMTSNGLFHTRPGSGQLSEGPPLPSSLPVNVIYEDQASHLLFGHLHPDYLRMYDLVSYNKGKAISLNWIAEKEARIINIWGSNFYQEMNVSSHGGFTRITFPHADDGPFRKYLYDPEVPSGSFGHVMRGFTADDDGNIYANKDTKQPYWYRINHKTLELDTLIMRGNAGEVVNHFGSGTNLLNHKGDIYGSSSYRGDVDTGHVYRFSPATDKWSRWKLPELDQVVRWMMPGRTSDELLLFTEASESRNLGRIFYFYPERDSFYNVLPAGPEDNIQGYPKRAILDSTRNCVWLASTLGLYRFDPKTDSLRRHLFPDGRQTETSDVVLRKDGTLMVGTFKTGLQWFLPDKGTFKKVGGIPEEGNPFTQSSNFLHLPSNDVASFSITPNKYLLVTTFNGMSLHGHTEGPGSIYSMRNGLPSNEFNTPSLFHNELDNRWYAGGINGFVSFRIDDLIRKTSPYKSLLLRSRTLDEDIGYEKTDPLSRISNPPLVLAPTVAYLTLEFTIPDYSGPDKPQYLTKLVGHDPGWRPPTTVPSVRYTRLNPGKYTFLMKAIDGRGRVTEDIRKLEIIILKPWYNTWWFYGFCLLAIALLIYWWVIARERRLRIEHHAKRQVQALELRALRQQLNPHFISNAMNAIRDYIYKEERDQAADYLTDFTRLMRLFLEASRNSYTSVRDEIDLLDRYIRLEQLRFPGKYSYRINVDLNIEKDMDEVPSLLLQPIVENAINHGLYPLKNGGELIIELSLDEEDDDILICKVTDNGVGRKISALKKNRPDHISRATQILEDRRKLLAENSRIGLRIITENVYDDREHTGTRVTVRIEPG